MVNASDSTIGILPDEFGGIETIPNNLEKVKKPRQKKIKIIPESEYLIPDSPVEYFGFDPFLCTWKDWVGVCRLVKNSSLFKEIYKGENFKWNDIEDSGYVYPVYIKEPEEIKNLDGKVIEVIPGIYNEDLTMVLPPKFMFTTYRQFLMSIPEFEKYTIQPRPIRFDGYRVETRFPPRDEQVDLANLARDKLTNNKVFKGIVQCPPGWGKTYISIHIGTITGGQTMIVVPNKLLQDQWIESIIEFTGLTKEDIGIIHGSDMGKLERKGVMKKPFVICLIQSLDSQLKRNNPMELAYFYRNVSIVYYDETHTSGAADGYAKTTGIFTTCNIVGLSATPYKKDKNLFQLYTGIGTIVYISTHQNLIPTCNMHLLPVKISNKKREELYRTFEKTNYNFFMSELENFLFEDHDYFNYISDWIDYRLNQGHSCVILFKTNKMLEKLKRYLEARPKPILDSTILTNETAKTNKKLLHDSKVILSNFKMFSAGADVPHLSTVFFASMVLGKIPIIQTLGRVTRKYANKVQDVQAHFLLPDFIYPLYSSNEPHLTISKAVKLTYPTAQFKWDKGFLNFFEEKKKAGESLVADNYKNFQTNQRGGVDINSGYNGNYQINGSYGNENRLSAYQQTMGAGVQQQIPNQVPQSVPPPIQNYVPGVVVNHHLPVPPPPPPQNF